jgi:hypothetical protein
MTTLEFVRVPSTSRRDKRRTCQKPEPFDQVQQSELGVAPAVVQVVERFYRFACNVDYVGDGPGQRRLCLGDPTIAFSGDYSGLNTPAEKPGVAGRPGWPVWHIPRPNVV